MARCVRSVQRRACGPGGEQSGVPQNDALNPTVASRPDFLLRFLGRVAFRRPAPAG
jgi:hypothetical protein